MTKERWIYDPYSEINPWLVDLGIEIRTDGRYVFGQGESKKESMFDCYKKNAAEAALDITGRKGRFFKFDSKAGWVQQPVLKS